MAKKKMAKKSKRSKKSNGMVKKVLRAGKSVRKGGMVVKRADLGADVGLYFAGLSAAQGKLAKRLDRIVRSVVPSASAAIKWGMPVYEHRGMLCYIRARPRYVTLGFYGQATGLSDPKGLMEGTGKGMRHIKIETEGAMDEEYLRGLVRQAAGVNEMAAG